MLHNAETLHNVADPNELRKYIAKQFLFCDKIIGRNYNV